jgi:hypothetical protein
LADWLVADTFTGTEEPEGDLSIRGHMLWDTLRVQPAGSTEAFLDYVEQTLELVPNFESHDLLVVEWDAEMWQALGTAFREEAEARLAEMPGEWVDLVDLLRQCLDAGSLAPLREHHHRQIDQRQARLRALERGFQTGDLAFSPNALTAFQAPSTLGEVSSETSEPGRGGGGRTPPMTVNQAVRGRVAELFVLEVCWRRFLALDPADRGAVLDTIAAYRQEGPGDVPWGTATAWRKLRKDLDAYRAALIGLSADDDGLAEPGRVFKALIEVADERGPGFDVLDPFGEWGADGDETPSPRRVEIKAILPPEESPDGHRVVLTTNEFHRARQHSDSYVLRLIHVPRDGEDVAHVRWAADVPDPVGSLQLDQKIVLGVRSGTLPFIVRSALQVARSDPVDKR